MRAFTTTGRGARRRVQVTLDLETCTGLADLLEQVAGLLEPEAAPGDDRPVDPLVELTGMDPSAFGAERTPRAPFWSPDDPALARLLPDAHRDDPALAEEFRRLTEHGLRRRKQSSLATAAQALRRPGRPNTLEPDEAHAVLVGLTDVRLVIAERLGLRTDDDAEAVGVTLRTVLQDVDERGEEAVAEHLAERPWLPAAFQYDHLTMLQEELVQALSGR